MTELMKALQIPFKLYHSSLRSFNRIYNRMMFSRKKVSIGNDWKINGRIYIKNQGQISVGKRFLVNSSKVANPIGGDTVMRFIVRNRGILKIGDHVGISNSTIVCCNNVTIGDDVFIGGSCKIWDTDFHSIDPVIRTQKGDTEAKTSPILIKNRAFIGGGSLILKGVTIGENSVIGAGSVVAKNVPDNQIWAGNPARFIRELNVKDTLYQQSE
jgi:acetyltransferase-like isoleucine patch superfamily enzyme